MGTIPSSNLTAAVAWQAPSATTVQAQANTDYLLTNSQQVTITLPAWPNVGDIIEVAGVGSGGWVLAQNPGQTIAASFTPVQGEVEGYWTSIASSSDGTKLAAVASWLNGNGGIWTFFNGVASTSTASFSGSTMPGTAGFLEGNSGTVVELLYAGAGQFFALYQTGSLSGH